MDNLVVNHDKPFAKYVPKDGKIDEIYSAEWYNWTYEEKVKDPSQTIILTRFKEDWIDGMFAPVVGQTQVR